MNAINFFEIAASNFERAVNFYQNLLGIKVFREDTQGIKMAFFPSEPQTVSGAICHGAGYEPSSDGVLLYLNGGDDMSEILKNVEDFGGKVVRSKTLISDKLGSYALFIDTEGNKLGIHSNY